MTDGLLPMDLPDAPRRRTGPARAAVEAAMKAWRAAGHLVGPEDAARRRVLRDSADAVDAAAAVMHGHPRCPTCKGVVKTAFAGSPGTLAYANHIHAALLATVQPTGAAVTDPYTEDNADDDLAAAITAALSVGPDDAPPADAAPGDDV